MEPNCSRKQNERRWISAFRQAKLAQSGNNDEIQQHVSSSHEEESDNDILCNVTTVTMQKVKQVQVKLTEVRNLVQKQI